MNSEIVEDNNKLLSWLALVVMTGLALLIGAVSYKVSAYLDPTAATRAPVTFQRQTELLDDEGQLIEPPRHEVERYLNVSARRPGYMQAELMRLKALRERLVLVSGLDKREFDFSEGPAMAVSEQIHLLSSTLAPGFLRNAGKTSARLDIQSGRLTIGESPLLHSPVKAFVHLAGWPTIGGWVTSGYGERPDPFTGHAAFHEGVDIASRSGSEIMSIGGGVVNYAGDKEGYGCIVEIDHGNGYITRYAHCKSVLVRVGDHVSKGQGVALVGTTGRSTGPHVHFEVLRYGRAVDPGFYLQPSL